MWYGRGSSRSGRRHAIGEAKMTGETTRARHRSDQILALSVSNLQKDQNQGGQIG